MAAHGVTILEIEQKASGRWEAVRPSRYARRITADTPMRISGPATGHAMMQTSLEPTGRMVRGTLNNCAHGVTPWGTYLTCEENFAFYFHGPEKPTAHHQRWGLRARPAGYRWHEHEDRFDATKHPNEFNRFGWVVEIDPLDPTMTPIKRTALGRAAHEGAWVSQTKEGRVVVYMGEDAQFEYIYKFISRDAVKTGGFASNRDLLDHGTLYVARFDADGKGRWLPLVHGQGPLTTANGFADQGEVLIKARQASDALGATKMDRPEWIAIDPNTAQIYCTLTNNSRRGAAGLPAVDAANPRANNTMGHIIRWKEAGDFDAMSFTWDHYVLAGDPANARADAKGTINGDSFGSPDGLWFDQRGVLWIQTDAHASNMYKDDYAQLGSNMMLAADPRTGETRRFLVGPPNCEVTGVVCTPDMRTMFVNIQHPGESPSDRSDPNQPTRFSTWPEGPGAARPRSATVVIRKRDGGVIGT
jgi:secreted PhoX family phosphatase